MILMHYCFAGHGIKPYLRLIHAYNYLDSHKYNLSLIKGQSMPLYVSCILQRSLNGKPHTNTPNIYEFNASAKGHCVFIHMFAFHLILLL